MTTNKETTLPGAGKRNTLGKDERLSRRKIIEELHSKGTAIKSPAVILVYRFDELPVDFPAQAMFTVSKRNFKRAHDRNRIKRLMKEAYRKQKQLVYTSLRLREQQAALMFIFTGRQIPDYPYVHGKISDLLKRFKVEISTVKPQEKKDTPK